ncbi:MAG TPA: hypothetical protein VF883_01780 [Thermoanaerobaculia bacterium]|jgi:hypothetical protein
MSNLFRFDTLASALPLISAGILLLILIISFRSRAKVFCQYLETMTGISLRPADVRRVYRERGREGVRELFLDLIIREDLKEGPLDPDASQSRKVASP